MTNSAKHRLAWWAAGFGCLGVGVVQAMLRFSALGAAQIRPWAYAIIAVSVLVLAVTTWFAYTNSRNGAALATGVMAVLIGTGLPLWGPGYVAMLTFIFLVATGVFQCFPGPKGQNKTTGS